MFTGCENFLKAQEVKEEILSAIEYNNAPSYTILVEALNRDVGVIKTPVTGQVSQKVTDTFTVKFEPDSKYTFMKWQAVIEGIAAGETTEDYIEFEDPQSLETKVKFKKAPPSVISLRPVCPENLTVSFNLSDAAEIYPCDSTIQLSFNKPITAACKDKVLVKIPDIPEARTALSYFKPSQLQNKDLTLFADVSEDDYSNLIPVTASGKIISVILNASDFYYENTDYGETIPIYLKNDITFSYSINSNTTKKSTIKYVVPANIASVGLLRVDEDDARTQSYRVGKEINLKYILQNDDYAFKGWSFAYASTDAENAVFEPVAIQDIKKNLNIDIKYENNEDTLGYDALTKTAQATITVYNYKEGIISVSPVVGSISKTQIATTDPSETGVGEFKVNGVTASDNVIEYRPGQTLVLKYKLTKSDDYRFLGWSVKRELTGAGNTQPQVYSQSDFTEENLANFKLSAVYEDNADTFGYDSLSHNAQLTICVNEYIDGDITISPVVVEIPKAKVWIDGTNGKLSPAKGEYTARQNGQKNTISFEPDGDYEFVHWQVYNKNNGNPLNYSDYISIDVNKSETTYEILNIPTTASNIQIALRPVVTERPKIISATPSYDAQGAFRDARIQVMFDRPMDEKSIYFTDEELPDLIASIPAADFFPPYDENDPAKKYYGYKKDGNIIFKNITIIDNKNLTTNLLQYFDAPRFDDSRRLSIPTIKGHEPPSGTALLVTLGNNFSYEYQNGTYKKDITMRESYKWVYFVNSKKDSAGPEVAASSDKTEILTVSGDGIPTSSSSAKVYLNSEKKIKLRLSAVDTGSGPSDYFDLKLYNANADVTDETVNPISTIPVYYENVAGIYATCGNAIDDVPDSEKEYHECVLTGLPSNDGDYKFTLTFYDKNGNPTLLKDGNPASPVCYYVSLDTTKPTLTTKSLEACVDTSDSTKTAIKFKYQSNDTDYNGGKIYYRQAVAKTSATWSDWTQVTTNETLVTGNNTEHEVIIKGLEYGTAYELKAEIKDNANNKQSYIFKKNTMPQAFDATKLTLTLDKKSRALSLNSTELPRCEKVNVTYTLSSKYADADGGTAVSKPAIEKEIDKTELPFVAKYANWGSKYDFTLQTRDYETVEEGYSNSGTSYTNENPTITTKSIITKPIGVMFLNSAPTVTTDSISFKLEKGDGAYKFSGLRLYKAEYDANGTLGNFTEFSESQIERTNYQNWKIKDITIEQNKRYRIKIVTYYNTRDNVCDDDQIVEFDAVLPETVISVQKPSSSPTVTENGTTAKTASFVIKNYANSKPGEDFTHYLVEWYYNTLNTYTAKVPKFSESTQTFTATGLEPDKTYTFRFYVCNDYLKGNGTSKYPKTAKLPNYETPAAPENIWISSVKRKGSSSYMYGPDFNYTIPEELGTKYYSSTVQLLQGTTYNNITAAVDTSADNEKIPFEGSLPYIENATSGIRHSTSFPGGVKYFQIKFKISDNDIRYSKKFAFDPSLSTYNSSGKSTLIPFQNIQWTSTYNSVTFTWDAGYQFKTVKYRKCGSTDSWASVNNSSYNSDIKTFTVSGLAANTEYDFEFYNTLSNAKKGVAIAQTKYAPPTAVTYPSATAKTIDSVTLGWTHATNRQYYNIYQVTSQGNTLVADQVTDNSIKITGLSANQTYSFKIASVNEAGEEVCSTIVSQKTDAVTAITSLPQVPITGYTSTDNSLTVKYDVPAFDDINTPDLYSLDLYYKKSSDPDTSSSWNHKSCNVSYSSITINDLEACTSYDVKLIFSKDDMQSDPTYKSCVTKPKAAEFNRTASQLNSDSITLKWENPTGNYYQTRVYYYPYLLGRNTSEYYLDIPVLIAVINSTDENPQDTFVLNDVYPDTNYKFYTYTFGDDNLIYTSVRSEWLYDKTAAN